MVGKPAAVDELLGGDVADAEEDGGGDGLGEEGPRGEAGFVPFGVLEGVGAVEMMGR